MNKVILMGRLTADPELRTTGTGVSVCNFKLAVNRRFVREKTDFIRCIAWRQTAEFICKYFTKGSMIAVAGSLQTDSYEKDGQTHYTTDVNVEEANFTGSKTDALGNQSTENSDDSLPPLPTDDDLPF